MIQNIDINRLHPHPMNPRKDLGDISELAESIKTQGILQNLTVIPKETQAIGPGGIVVTDRAIINGEYTVIIGHRRLAASKLAGLTEVPCVITNMDHRQQVATMLLENMQRADLTIYEQAQGFQMMIDLGETVADISEKTGFSDTTVRRRVKLLELDQEKFKASEERNVSLMDYMELEKIESIELRNEVLDSIGTSNFKNELYQAIDKEKTDKNMKLLIQQLDTFATEVEGTNGLTWCRSYYPSQDDKVQLPEDEETIEYYYVISNYGYITLYKDSVETDEDIAADEKRELEKARHNALDEITKRAFLLRRNFVTSISNNAAKNNIGIIIESTVFSMLEDYYGTDYKKFADLINVTLDEDRENWFENIVDTLRQQPERCLFLAVYCKLDSKNDKYFSWDCTYRKNDDLEQIYGLLEKFGYETSDEEQAMRDGSHPLFAEEGTE